MKLSVVTGFRREEVGQWGQRYLLPGSTEDSAGLACFKAVTDIGYAYEVHIVSGDPETAEHPSFRWVNTKLGNVKNALRVDPLRDTRKALSFLAILPNLIIDFILVMTYRSLSLDGCVLLFVQHLCLKGR